MDFQLSTDEAEFKNSVKSFFESQKDLAVQVRKEIESGNGFGPATWTVLKRIGSKGWLCPTWPEKYGGLGLSFMYRYIIQEEMHCFFSLYGTVGAGMAGPVILRHGSESQKEKYLLPIAKGEIEFALGYTEPEAGSDLASLAIFAEDKGDHFIINGQKAFNTRAHYSQYHWLGARTKIIEPKHKGISLLIVDLATSGITISPYYTVGGTRTNGIYYDNVKVSKDALVGEMNKGFYYIIEALSYERIMTVSALERDFKMLVEYTSRIGKGKDPVIRQRLAEIAIDIEAAKMFALKVSWMLDNNMIPSFEAAMLKIQVTETEQRMINTGMQIMGHYGQVKTGSTWAQINGQFEWRYKDSLEEIIVRGTSEIMRNIIAERALGMPKN
jgi:alkylation response protein AidB-like acyl-CoA dehydrogenase